MIHYMDFIQYPNRHVFSEMDKRGNNKQHKDPKTGKVKKDKNKPKLVPGTFHHIGYGAVENTIVTTKAELDKMRQNRRLLFSEICVSSSSEPIKKKRNMMIPQKEYVLPTPKEKKEEERIPPLLQQWYEECEHNDKIGAIGQLPTCYQNSLPSIDLIMQTPVGETLVHFCKFNRNKW